MQDASVSQGWAPACLPGAGQGEGQGGLASGARRCPAWRDLGGEKGHSTLREARLVGDIPVLSGLSSGPRASVATLRGPALGPLPLL